MTTLQIDTKLLDGGLAEIEFADIPASALTALVAYSQAVSLKRIADLLEGRQGRGEAPPLVIADPIIRLGMGDAGGIFPATTISSAAVDPVRDEEVIPPSIPAGYIQITADMPVVDPATGSPVDRTTEVRVLYAGGNKRKSFAGSVAWRNTNMADPWRPVAYMPLGDGSAVGVE